MDQQPSRPANRKYKDSFFRTLFNHPERLCGLYNALTGERARPEDIVINTLDGTFAGLLKNDLSALVLGRTFICAEHQSTLNANMPLRHLIYFTRILEQTIDRDAMYKRGAIPIPKPYFYVLCNSPDMVGEVEELRLSTSFMAADEQRDDAITIELVVKVYNINYEPGREILERCEPLRAYSLCTSKIREGTAQGLPLEKAIERAMDYCIANGMMREFFNEHRKELNDMIDFEWDEKKALDARFEEGREEGLAQGVAQGLENGKRATALEMMRENEPLSKISRYTRLAESSLRSLAQAHGLAVL